jgi:Na+-transporting NADH:ubiquinone oxidoreductase subunit NqrC
MPRYRHNKDDPSPNTTSGYYIMVFVIMFFIVLVVIVGRVIYSANDVQVDQLYLKYNRNSVAMAALSQCGD